MHDTFSGAKVALFIGDHLLVILRDDRDDIPFPAHWDFPGGGREDDEAPIETAARETREEVGLDLGQAEILWQRRFNAVHSPGAFVWFFVARMPAHAKADIVFGDEGQEWRLVTEDGFAQLSPVVPSFAARLALWRAQTA